MRCTRTLEQNKDTDQKIEESDDLEVSLLTEYSFGLRPDNDIYIENSSPSLKCIACLGPGSQFVKDLGHLPVILNRPPVDDF